MKVQVFDYRWREPEPKNFYIEFEGNNGEKFGRKKLWVGHSLSVKLEGKTNCAGHISPETHEWKKCPKESTGKFKCEYCRSIEGSFVFTAFDGFDSSMLNASDLAKIDGEHWVYLAFFGKNMVKIGVSKLSRKLLRQVEQGSAATLFIAKTPDGIAARQIETLIRKTGLIDKIKTSQKKDFLFTNTSKAEEILRETLQKHVHGLDEEYKHLKEHLLAEPEFFDWGKEMKIEKISANVHPLKLKPGEWISGEIVALKGPFIVLNTGEEFVSFAPKDLRGKEVNFELKSPGTHLQNALQNVMFE